MANALWRWPLRTQAGTFRARSCLGCAGCLPVNATMIQSIDDARSICDTPLSQSVLFLHVVDNGSWLKLRTSGIIAWLMHTSRSHTPSPRALPCPAGAAHMDGSSWLVRQTDRGLQWGPAWVAPLEGTKA